MRIKLSDPISLKNRQSQRGMALVTVLMFSVVLLTISVVAAKVAMESQSQLSSQFSKNGQASNIAQAGLQDGLAWFKRTGGTVKWNTLDPDQPCADSAFFPREDTSDPELGDTIDESVGMVKELEIEGKVWGRYTLKRQNCGSLDPHAVRDITIERGKNTGSTPGQGVAWYLESEGLVYYREDPSKEPDESPNRILARSEAAVELHRLSMQPPKAPLTLVASGGSGSNFNNKCKIIGDSETNYGVVRNNTTPGASGTPEFTLPGSAIATWYHLSAGDGQYSVESIFNLSKDDLKGVSDNVYSSLSDIPNTPIPMSINYLEGDYTFTASKKLLGSGVLFVDGNLTLENDSNSSFSGLIYVDGTLTVRNSNSLGGAVVAKRVVCTPGNSSVIEYSDDLMNNVRTRLGGYRKNNVTFVVKK